MFYFALKIKRPEVVSRTYVRPAAEYALPRLQRSGKSLCFVAAGWAPFRLGMQSKKRLRPTEISMTKIKAGDKVARDTATVNQGKAYIGDQAPVFVRPIRAGDRATCDSATANQGKVHLGDQAPVFVRAIRAGDKATRDTATANQGKVHLGDQAPVFALKK
jgi:hypothetical protein